MNRNMGILIVACVVAATILGYWLTPGVRKAVNEHFFSVQKADDESRYTARKTVEDTARSMMASYISDKFVYEQYRDAGNAEKRSWGEQAKMRANKTAASYNEYILKNSFVWEDNVPRDIEQELIYLE